MPIPRPDARAVADDGEGQPRQVAQDEGDKVKSGDVIAEIETDKATMEVEAVDEGTLGKILVPEGTDDVAVNTPIAVILGGGRGRLARSSDRQRRRAAAAGAESGSAGRARGARQPPAEADRPPPPRRRSRRPQPEPDVPAGTEMVTMTVREALRDAMAEEMRRDADVFVMGEEVAEYQGAYKVTPGAAAGVRRASA